MYGDGFGCLHTEDIFGHKKRFYPFSEKTPAVAYVPHNANVNSVGGTSFRFRKEWPPPRMVFICGACEVTTNFTRRAEVTTFRLLISE